MAYAIGVANPVSFTVDTFRTGKHSDAELESVLQKLVNMTPDGIISRFDLRRPIYRQTASYGHFGRTDLQLPWEQTDLVPALQAALQ